MTVFSTKRLICDIDDTILQFSSAFQRWADQQGLRRLHCIHEVGTIEASLGITVEQACPIVIDFLNSPAFAQIEPEKCAAEVLPQLHRAGYKFVAITACEPTPQVIEARHRNLRDAFGFEFEDVFISGFLTGQGKGPYLRRYEPTIYVEDNFHNAVLGAELGHNSFLMNRSVNRDMHDDRVQRFDTWHDIARLL